MHRIVVAALLLLGQQDDLKRLLDVTAPLADREGAVKTLARTKSGGQAMLDLVDAGKFPPELKATASFALAASPDAGIRAKAAVALPLPRSKDGKALPPLAELVAMKGDAKAGGLVYRNNTGGPNCIACHQIGDEGRQVGPPLTTIGTKLSREQMFESILTPSAAILMSYENWIVRTTDGDIKTGIKVEDTDDHITLKDTNGEYVDIPVKKVQDRKMLALSMMPEDITKTMSIQDLVNVVQYLTEQR